MSSIMLSTMVKLCPKWRLQRFAVRLNRNTLGILALAKEVFFSKKHISTVQEANNAANRCKAMRRQSM